MTTKYWNNATGDWYTGPGPWSDNASTTLPVPVSGDIAVLQSGTITITATDVANHGALADIDVQYGPSNAVLDITGGTIDAQSTIESLFSNGPGSLILRGTTSLAGTLSGRGGVTLTVDLEPNASVTRLNVASTGLIVAQSGTLVLTGHAGAKVVNAGTIMAGVVVGSSTYGGTLTASVSIDNTGAIVTNGFSTLTLTGAVTNAYGATISDSFGSIVLSGAVTNVGNIAITNGGTLTSSGTVSDTGVILAQSSSKIAFTGTAATTVTIGSFGQLQAGTTANNIASAGTITSTQSIDNSGYFFVNDLSTATFAAAFTNEASGNIYDTFGTLAFNGSLVNYGTLTQAGGVVSVLNALTNSGSINQSSGTLSIAGGFSNSGSATFNGTDSIAGGISGTGTITIGNDSTLTVAGSVGAYQNITFASAVGVLTLSTPANFAGLITNLSGHDVIDLVGLANATAVVNNDSVIVSNNGTYVTTFSAIGLAAGSLNSVSDNNGGTVLTLEQPGTEAAVVSSLLHGVPAGPARAWGPVGGAGPVVTYSFDTASAWTAAEQHSFVNALGMWSALAKITFVQASPGATGAVQFVRTSSGGTNTLTPGTGDYTTATVAVQTNAPGWTDIVSLGTSDTSGFGNYGWTTIVHEIGHALGLHHPGNYNVTGSVATQQTYYTDTLQYSLMSYMAAKYSNADYTQSGTLYNPETPMLFDIAAIQQIYGANTTTLAGNDIFGFNASGAITGNVALNAVYNFASNSMPIVTLYDAGTNNTLDLSGYATASTVNLNASSFSSFNGLTSNLAIADNTKIDRFVGGAGNDTITVNADADIIDGGGGANTAIFGLSRASYTMAFAGGTVTVRPVAGGVTDTLTNIQTLQFADTSTAACFLAGTLIMTDHGEVAIEHLRPGIHRAVTATGDLADIIWIGHRHARLAHHPKPWDVMPVRILTDAFGFGAPLRDLAVSPDHALLIDGVLIPARLLINGATVVQEHHDAVTWLHVELDHHDAILAEGLPTESYLDTGNRHAFDNGGTALMLHADFAASTAAARHIWAERGMAELVLSGPKVTAARATLITRATDLGFVQSDDSEPCLWVDGRSILPTFDGLKLAFALPPNAREIRLRANAASAADTSATSDDRRSLGLAVTSIEIDGVAVPVGHEAFGAGWHSPEPDWRWTTGDAALSCPGARSIRIGLADISVSHWARANLPERAARAN